MRKSLNAGWVAMAVAVSTTSMASGGRIGTGRIGTNHASPLQSGVRSSFTSAHRSARPIAFHAGYDGARTLNGFSASSLDVISTSRLSRIKTASTRSSYRSAEDLGHPHVVAISTPIRTNPHDPKVLALLHKKQQLPHKVSKHGWGNDDAADLAAARRISAVSAARRSAAKQGSGK